MNKIKIYGSESDMALRILMLLDVCREAMNIDRMVSYDFIATYGAYFDIGEENLHGDNEYSFGELAARRNVAFRSIRYLVTQELIRAEEKAVGFFYSISDKGKRLAGRMHSEYALRYRKIMKKVSDSCSGLTDAELRDRIDIRSRSVHDNR